MSATHPGITERKRAVAELRLTVRSPHGAAEDFAVTVPHGATISDVARALARRWRLDPPADQDISLRSVGHGPIPPERLMAEAGLHDGEQVELVAGHGPAGAPRTAVQTGTPIVA